MTDSQGATSRFAPNNAVTTTGQRATCGSAYDDVNRLLSITAPDLSISYTYDAVGNLLTMTDATGTTTYTYDALNRLTTIAYPSGQTIAYTYNEVGRITQIVTPFGAVGYGYDNANRLSSITLPNAQQVIYQYDATGNLLQIDYPNDTAAAYAYDLRNRLTAMTNFAPDNAVISTYAYTLDGVGNRIQTDLNEPMMPSYNPETISYTYYTGNILHTADGATYTHDANGNRTTKTNGTNVTSYTYDSLNRLTQVATSARTIQYIYNGLGQRVAKIDNGVQTNYLVDPNGLLPQVLAETDSTGNLIAYYVYDDVGLVAKVTPSNQYYFYHYDGLGSTVAMTNSNGEVVNTYCYSPEGLVGVQETIPNPFQYVGRFGVMAEGIGLYFMRARYYDPETGRFINKDPFGYAGGMNLYGYVGGNPIILVDPAGLHGPSRQLQPGEIPCIPAGACHYYPQYHNFKKSNTTCEDKISDDELERQLRQMGYYPGPVLWHPGSLGIHALYPVFGTIYAGGKYAWQGAVSPVLRVYKGGPFGPIIIIPDEETMRKMQQKGIIFGPTPAEAAPVNGD